MNDSDLCAEFLANGIVKIPVEDLNALKHLRDIVIGAAIDGNKYHEIIDKEDLNEHRLTAIRALNDNPKSRAWYFSLAKHAIEVLVGNELCQQKNINLSIQMPSDDSSLLPIHADVLQGDSEFEIVAWCPLVDVHDTKSMFFCDKKQSDECITCLDEFRSTDDLYQYLKPYLKFMDVKYGEMLLFSQNIFHGNTVNETNETRWSMNCRFKSVLSPFKDKMVGEFFVPISIKPATRLGYEYQELLN